MVRPVTALRSLLILLAIALVAGCGRTGGASPVSPSSASSATPSERVVATTSPPPSSSPGHATATLPAAVTATIDDPALAVTLPEGWQTLEAAVARAQLAQAAQNATGEMKTQIEVKLAEIDAGSIRLLAAGPSGFAPWQGTVTFEVFDTGSAETRIGELETFNKSFAPILSSERTAVKVPIGSAIRLSVLADVPKGFEGKAIPAHGLAYGIELDDGRILMINATGPTASTTFADMIDAAVASIRPR
jgi:hypothetical protein